MGYRWSRHSDIMAYTDDWLVSQAVSEESCSYLMFYGRSRLPVGFISSLCRDIDCGVDVTRFVQHSCTLCHASHAWVYSQTNSQDREIDIHCASSHWKGDGDLQRDMAGGLVCVSVQYPLQQLLLQR